MKKFILIASLALISGNAFSQTVPTELVQKEQQACDQRCSKKPQFVTSCDQYCQCFAEAMVKNYSLAEIQAGKHLAPANPNDAAEVKRFADAYQPCMDKFGKK